MSLSQAEIKNIRALQTKKGRRVANRFIAEGVRLIEEALRHRYAPEQVFAATSVLSERGGRMVDDLKRQRIPTRELSAREMAKISATKTPPGILAVFPIPGASLSELWSVSMRTIVMCEDIADPGNVGTMLRSALAFGVDLVILAGRCAEPFSPKVVRSSMGAVFGLPIVMADTSTVLSEVRSRQGQLIGSDSTGGSDPGVLRDAVSAAGDKPLVLAIGSETDGLSDAVRGSVDSTVRIAHATAVESLNAAVAGSILMREMYEARNRRRS
ncbi:hypothetical protein GF377_02365 [candidate division GN15 bacterium]|nr:hypothetical protein [candidate division GN15 bacterium]